MLTRKQVTALRLVDLTGKNKLWDAIGLARVTQGEVSKAIGISQSQVSEDCAGNYTEMSLDKARAYASFFGVHVDDLFPTGEKVSA